MDKETIDSYNYEAKSIAQLHSSLIPTRIYELIKEYFIKGGKTADIGCGIGRDTHWLNQQGFPTVGIDASKKMLDQAKTLYPEDHFIQDFLPSLSRLNIEKFENILCSAVLMHLKSGDLETACIRLIELLKENGRLIVSFRSTNERNSREKGKLYEPININNFLKTFRDKGLIVIIEEAETEIGRNIIWHNFVIINNNPYL
jgi:2-polyprenyl-3-methyl-5-hydroxy-6-metoxy-1,4-benzoquinol methylase